MGYGLVFTIGRGNEICCTAIESMRHLVIGQDLDSVKREIGKFYDHLRSDSQLQWLGPEKGVIHMALGCIVNAVWDMWSREEGKPVWRLLSEMSPHEFVKCLDFRYVSDVLTETEALEILQRNAPTKPERIERLLTEGYRSYTTSAGWLGYSDEKLARLCQEALEQGFQHIKLKVGENVEDDIRRCDVARNAIGKDVKLMLDANQKWDVDQAIEWVNVLSKFDPWFIEEPTSPDDVAGHKKIKNSIGNILVATGEHCQNRVLFKQFIADNAVDIVQIDACRMGGINEILTVYMIAAKYGKLVCPHAGGVGLCEYVQHLSMIDYVCISADIGERVIEYVDHLHEHFTDPCEIKHGSYVAPNQPGFSVEMKSESVTNFAYPDGPEWKKRRLQHGRIANA